MSQNLPDLSSLSFEQAMRELETIVRKLESGQGELENSINDYERGNALKEYCQAKLAGAKMKVEKIITSSDGKISTAPFEENKE
ncbi:MAG: exodeoxyribonuclease VII small subunit [Pseudomonadota bacterium]